MTLHGEVMPALPLETVPFNVFDRRYKTSWDAVMAQFKDAVDGIEIMCTSFVDTAFHQLRSAEGAGAATTPEAAGPLTR